MSHGIFLCVCTNITAVGLKSHTHMHTPVCSSTFHPVVRRNSTIVAIQYYYDKTYICLEAMWLSGRTTEWGVRRSLWKLGSVTYHLCGFWKELNLPRSPSKGKITCLVNLFWWGVHGIVLLKGVVSDAKVYVGVPSLPSATKARCFWLLLARFLNSL